MASEVFWKVGIFTLFVGLFGCERQISFADDVQPVFLAHCIECHEEPGEGYAASGFNLRDYESVMRGTKFGPAVIPGSSMSSSLYLVIAKKTAPEIQMPPHHEQAFAEGRGTALPEDQVEIVRAWIDQGAKNN